MRFRPNVFSRKAHKWLALIVGVQAVMWTASGLYMTMVHIDTIHGDHLVKSIPTPAYRASELISPAVAAKTVVDAQAVRLSMLQDRPVYVISNGGGQALVDARTGDPVARPTRDDVARIARQLFAGDGTLVSLSLLSDIPGEIRGRKPPIWSAQFSGRNKPTFYIAPDTGELVSRRHELWRVFDFFWMLHIMNYDERKNVNNLLLRLMTMIAAVTILFGAWLLFYAFPRKRRKAAR